MTSHEQFFQIVDEVRDRVNSMLEEYIVENNLDSEKLSIVLFAVRGTLLNLLHTYVTAFDTEENRESSVIRFINTIKTEALNKLKNAEIEAAKERMIDVFEKSDMSGMPVHKEVMSMREEILEAFIAKYGCQPDEAIIIQSSIYFFIMKKGEIPDQFKECPCCGKKI